MPGIDRVQVSDVRLRELPDCNQNNPVVKKAGLEPGVKMGQFEIKLTRDQRETAGEK